MMLPTVEAATHWWHSITFDTLKNVFYGALKIPFSGHVEIIPLYCFSLSKPDWHLHNKIHFINSQDTKRQCSIIPRGIVQKPSFNAMAYLEFAGMSFMLTVCQSSFCDCTNIWKYMNCVLVDCNVQSLNAIQVIPSSSILFFHIFFSKSLFCSISESSSHFFFFFVVLKLLKLPISETLRCSIWIPHRHP